MKTGLLAVHLPAICGLLRMSSLASTLYLLAMLCQVSEALGVCVLQDRPNGTCAAAAAATHKVCRQQSTS